MNSFWQSLRFAGRSLTREPLLAITVILSLALGIGINSAVYSLLNMVLLRPLPAVQAPDRIAAVFSLTGKSPTYLPVSYLNYKDFRERNRVFSDLAAYQTVKAGLAGQGDAQQVTGEMVSGNFFRVLGVRPSLGRGLLPEDDTAAGAHPVAVLSYGLWQDRFGSDTKILGRAVLLNKHPFTVVGVGPRGFKGMTSFQAADFWVPLAMYRSVYTFPDLFEKRSGQVLLLLGRLKPGMGFQQAASGLKAIAANLAAEYPEDNKDQTTVLFPLTQAAVNPNLRATFSRAGTILMAIVAVLLLIACLNVANMLLVRALARGKETAIRLSLGASRARLAGQLLAESMLLAVLGGGASLLAARWTRDVLWKFRPPFFDEGALQPALDPQVLLFTLALSVLTGLFFGLVPLLQSRKPDLARVLRENRDLAAGGAKGSLGSFFVALEVAFCALCLASAGLFLENLYQAQKIDPGFDTQRVLMASVDLGFAGYDEPTGRQTERRVIERVRALPGVESAALGENRLLGGFRLWRKIVQNGKAQDDKDPLVGSSIVGTDYFRTVGIPLVRGRAFDDRDRQGAPQAVVVNEALARQFWPSEDALGKRFRLDDETSPVEVVGVARNSKYRSLGEAPSPFLYLPLEQRYSARATLYVRSAGRPEGLLPTVRREVQALDPVLPWTGIQAASEAVAQSLWLPKVSALLLSTFSLLALVLAAVGVYGVTSYSVRRRRYEIGIRMALGAKRPRVVLLVLRKGVALLSVGLCVGLLAAIFISRWVTTLLYGEASPGLVFLGVALVLALVGLAANLVPAYNAARFDPAVVLRDQ